MRLLWVLLLSSASVFSQQFDLLIRNGHIIDGTGSPWYSADIGIRAGRIAAIGHLGGAHATKTIDARGMVVAPGFIDMLGQSEATILVNPNLPSKIYQGITTEITGEGQSIAPLTSSIIAADRPRGIISALCRTGRHTGNISRAWRNRASGSTWRTMSAQPACGAR